MLDVRRLHTLRELAGRGTIAATADAMHLTPSAVSQQLSALERELGRPLLRRRGQSVHLLPAAYEVLRHANVILAEIEHLDATLAAFDEGRGGLVRVGSFGSAIAGLVVPAAAALSESHPGLTLEIEELEPPDALVRLARDELDLVIAMEAANVPPWDDARIARTPLMADPLQVALPSGHPAAREAAVDLVCLAEETWVAPPAGWSCDHVVHAACVAAGFRPAVRHRSADWSVVLQMVAGGLGVALVPRLASGAVPAGAVVRPLGPPAPARQLFAATRSGADQHPAVKHVLASLVRVVRDQ
jgi:DNA-binding transcriptional LysR family regulator